MRMTMMVAALVAAGAATGGELTVEPGGLTPAGALEKIRAAKKAGDRSAWTVHVKKGVHPLTESLTLTPADSGSPDAPVTWIGEGDGSVISGGDPIRGWRDEGGGVWSAPIPKTPTGEVSYFEQLWVNGRRADRARIPNRCPGALTNEYCKIANPSITPVTNAATKAVTYVERCSVTNGAAALLAQVPADELPYAQMCVVHMWSTARRIIRGFDAATGTVTTHSPETWCGWQAWSVRATIVSFENVRSGFDAPGEWFYDAKAGRVLYRPLPGEDMAKALAVAPSAKISRLVDVAGDPEKEIYVHDIAFRNLAFEYSDAAAAGLANHDDNSPSTKKVVSNGPTESWQHQAASGMDGALTFEGAHRFSFENCRFRHTGNYGLRFNDGCVSNTIVNCTLEDLGAGGVWMGARRGRVRKGESYHRRWIDTLAPTATAFNRIENCTIRNAGLFNPEGTGIAMTHVSDSKVLHCDIYDIYYTGISVGWTWGFSGSVAQRNEIAYNRIYDLGKGIMSDMGGVYTLGTSFGTRVHDNIIHDVWSYYYGGWALYCDEGSEGIVMERNLCWNTTDGGFHQHYGTGCIIRNNIFAWNKTLGAVRTQRQIVQRIPCTVHFVNNIVLVNGSPLVARGPIGVGGVWANNVWWDVAGKPVLDGRDWAQWVETGKETGGLYADPMFEDAAKFDFRLKPGSPAFRTGFKAWDYSKAGANLPAEVTAFPAISAPRAITSGPHDHFLANYFAINAWSPDLRYVAVLETDVNGRLPNPGERITLGLVDTRDGNRFIPVTTTACWNFQEATMFHWLPGEKDSFVFNDFRSGKFVAVVMNWRTKRERIVPHPVSAVSRDGRLAVSLNYARLYLTRPDYGYAGDGQDAREKTTWPEDDGLWLVDLKTGAAKLILSVAQGRALMPPTVACPGKPGNPLAYYCHTVFNPSANRIFFLARSVDWYEKATHRIPRWNTTAFTVGTDGTDLRRCFPDTWGGSHFNWLDDRTMVVTVYPKEADGRVTDHHVRFTVGEEEKVRVLAPGLLDWDGHCVWSPNGKWMSTEGYYDHDYNRHWALMRSSDEAVRSVGSFFVPEKYRPTYWRCDLHARWRPDGRQLAFNSVHEGSRQVYVMDVAE